MFTGGGSGQSDANAGSFESAQAIWPWIGGLPGTLLCFRFFWSARSISEQFFGLKCWTFVLCMYSIFSSNWRKWPRSWSPAVWWFEMQRWRCRMAIQVQPRCVPWRNSSALTLVSRWVHYPLWSLANRIEIDVRYKATKYWRSQQTSERFCGQGVTRVQKSWTQSYYGCPLDVDLYSHVRKWTHFARGLFYIEKTVEFRCGCVNRRVPFWNCSLGCNRCRIPRNAGCVLQSQ